MRFSKYLGVEEKNGKKIVKCLDCGYEVCDGKDNWREHVMIYDQDPKEVFPYETETRAPSKSWCIYREFYCPNCGLMFDVQPIPKGYESEPVRQDVVLDILKND